MTSQAPAWLQILLSVIGLLGGTGGVVAAGAVLVQRRKLRAEAADVLTDTALELVQPLRDRVSELQTEVVDARRRAAATAVELDRARDIVHDLTRMLLRIREAILADPTASPQLREMVRSAPGPGEVNGRL